MGPNEQGKMEEGIETLARLMRPPSCSMRFDVISSVKRCAAARATGGISSAGGGLLPTISFSIDIATSNVFEATRRIGEWV